MNKRTRNLLVFFVVVLAFAGLGFGLATLGGKADSGSAAMDDAATYPSGPFRGAISINPTAPRVGKNQLRIGVSDTSGEPVRGASITAFGEMPAMGAMAAMRAPAELRETEPGLYTGPLALEMRGEWPLSISIRKDGIGETRLGFDMATGRSGLSLSSGGTPVNAMNGSSKGMAADSAPSKDDRGFYTVGNYKVKVDVLGAAEARQSEDMGADAATVMMAGSNRLRVTVLGQDDQPLPGATVRVAAQRDAAGSMAGDSAMSSMQSDRGQPTGEHAGEPMMDGSEDEHAGQAMSENAGDEHAGEPMMDGSQGEHAGEPMMDGSQDEHAGHAMPGDAGDEHAGDRMTNQPESGNGHMHGAAGMDHMAMQAMDTPRNSAVVTLRDMGEGVYQGELVVPGDGDYVLAVDVSTQQNGHGDLVLAFTTGEYGLNAANATAEGIAYYTCSMHPSVREAGPGQCPICSMDLTPVSKEQVASGVITIDSRRRQMIGVQTGQARMRALTKTIRAVGKVSFDERRVNNVTLKFDAWIGDLKADFVGTQVNKGQQLFSVYSPELLSAQQEYLETRQRLSARGPDDSLVRAARKRLMLWDISPAQVRALERRGEPLEYLPIVAPASGTVVEKMINDGSAMKRGDMLLRIADLSTVWIDAEVYEADLPLIEPGMGATVTLPYQADARLEATVDYIYPYLTGSTRTARIRLVLDNPDGVLKPDMYAEVRLNVDLGRRLVVPSEAVLVAGESRVVFKDLGDEGKLKPVRVTTGQRVDDWTEITAGLSPGDTVVTSGNFLIASEAKLKTGIEQW